MVRANKFSPFVTTLLVALAFLFLFLYLRAPQITFVESSTTSTHYLAKESEGLLKQTALHLSKMQSGVSIGGFPGFEPPNDDERYKRKVKGGEYNAQDVNDWVKEIINFLRQIADKNPGKTLEEILIKQGLNAKQVDEFVHALRNVHATASGMEGAGVTSETVKALKSILDILGVATWLP
jgi:hypothetical protein